MEYCLKNSLAVKDAYVVPFTFKLVYIPGTAMFNNNIFGSSECGAIQLNDNVVGAWETIGYDKMYGRIPACYQYSSVTTIKVMPVFED